MDELLNLSCKLWINSSINIILKGVVCWWVQWCWRNLDIWRYLMSARRLVTIFRTRPESVKILAGSQAASQIIMHRLDMVAYHYMQNWRLAWNRGLKWNINVLHAWGICRTGAYLDPHMAAWYMTWINVWWLWSF